MTLYRSEMESHPDRPRRVTLKEVAQEVGVSICTVSVVLNGSRSGSHISERTQATILESAARLGYRPNQVARTLKDGRTRIIGLIPSTVDLNMVMGPHLQQVMNGVVNVLEEAHLDLLLLTRCDPKNAGDVLDVVLDGRLDGVIMVSPRHDSRVFALLQDAGFPAVMIDGDTSAGNASFSVDNQFAVNLAIDHLVGLGHHRIAHLAGNASQTIAQQRFQAYMRRMEYHSLPIPDGYVQVAGFHTSEAFKAVQRLIQLTDRPTAVFCANDDMAIGAIEGAKAVGLDIPIDLSVVGFDDVPHAPLISPGLTTVHHPIAEIGRRAAESLIALIEGQPRPIHPDLPVHLVIRGSTAKPMVVSS